MVAQQCECTELYTYTWLVVAQLVKNRRYHAGDTRDMSSIPGSGRSPGGADGNPLQ